MKSIHSQLLLFLRGVAMGAVDLVPGVSAGTIALVTGIYGELINTIKSFNLTALKILKNDGIAAAWQQINGQFLLILLSGILFSLFTFAGMMRFLLATFPLQLWCFFMGLIISSVIYLLRQNPPSKPYLIGLLIMGILMASAFSVMPSAALGTSYVSIFIAGSIALCAMILPGISGSFILVLLGLYPMFIDALASFHVDFLMVFAMGGIVGLMLLSRILSWLMSHYKAAVIATMSGFLLGSLSIIWPWKNIAATVLSSENQLAVGAQNILPQNYLATVGQEPYLLSSSLAFVVGLLVVFLIERLAYRSGLNQEQGA
jgi:putative membrane protein